MYKYTQLDQALVQERVDQYRDQLTRNLSGELSDEDFRPLRLQNGLYIQRHAPMLRVAIPYGLLSSVQLHALAEIAEKYDRGYAHFSTRQNIQYNWPTLESSADILQDLAKVEMHAIQTSGNCIRNITSDQFAGVAADEILDPRPYCEILRQWSTFHPEFAHLPRKFKIAVSASKEDRAATSFHDIGLFIVKNDAGEIGLRVLVGGGLGRTPIVGSVIREFLPWQHMMSYCEAVLRVYNRHGRRDNMYKARIKILVKALGAEEFARQVEAEFKYSENGPSTLTEAEMNRVRSHFTDRTYPTRPAIEFDTSDKAFTRWRERNVKAHKVEGYNAVVLSLKPNNVAPGDATTEQLHFVADLAEQYSFGEIRVSHEQNLILADVAQEDLKAVWEALKTQGLATPNIGLLTDIIACPGGDFCALANAKSIPIANAIQNKFDDLDYLYDLGDIQLNISGCMNSCGHHHVGHIGILGVDKDGDEWYQISLGGSDGSTLGGYKPAVAKIIGPSFSAAQVPDVIEKIINTYVAQRTPGEHLIETVQRIGIIPFKEAVYPPKVH
ncbi:Sulfite reductase [ferredoxin] [Ephemeroptericola cinctiostellae]|uniref:Sulfite reductase [ferredoxin] n=1 Tax=Ephemeroptericola cinctiostellae TaxID=2268024 RepID=A0A345DCE9_9BURK|nr:nitrite/sulfite reductase [Ephemeroptericola cinctiostellae]AXF86037.1 Sulfite reductase [ferredoxin] [Ephemeroptericola cinctiostellae]